MRRCDIFSLPQVCGDHQRALFNANRDPFEQDGRFSLIPAQIAEIVTDPQVERVP